MGEIVNLRRVKKRLAAAQAEAVAAENRARHGRTAVEKAAERGAAARLDADLDGARL